jgi:GC-rich sequence DNA-binding factor
MFLKAVFPVFEAEVVALEERVKPFLRLNQPRFDPAAIPARRRVLVRMAKLADCILLWRKFSEELFGIGRLVSRLLELEMRVGETGWEVGGEEIVRKVSDRFTMRMD